MVGETGIETQCQVLQQQQQQLPLGRYLAALYSALEECCAGVPEDTTAALSVPLITFLLLCRVPAGAAAAAAVVVRGAPEK